MNYFPLFINLEGKQALAVGGGEVALRRIRALLDFGCAVTLVAPEVVPGLRGLAEQERIQWISRAFAPGDCAGAFLVLAMTDSRAVNHAVWEEAKKAGAFVNAADCKEECDFYFPGIAAGGGIVAGITAEGENHRLAKEVTGQFRELLRERNHREGNG